MDGAIDMNSTIEFGVYVQLPRLSHSRFKWCKMNCHSAHLEQMKKKKKKMSSQPDPLDNKGDCK